MSNLPPLLLLVLLLQAYLNKEEWPRRLYFFSEVSPNPSALSLLYMVITRFLVACFLSHSSQKPEIPGRSVHPFCFRRILGRLILKYDLIPVITLAAGWIVFWSLPDWNSFASKQSLRFEEHKSSHSQMLLWLFTNLPPPPQSDVKIFTGCWNCFSTSDLNCKNLEVVSDFRMRRIPPIIACKIINKEQVIFIGLHWQNRERSP